jgi:hypothetical protein
MTDPDLSQTETRGPVSFDVLSEFPTHADALREIERLRTAGSRLKQALMVVSNVWGQHHVTAEDGKYHVMVDRALDIWKEARGGRPHRV